MFYIQRTAEQVKVPPPEAVALFFALEGAPLLANPLPHQTDCPATFRFPSLCFPAIAHIQDRLFNHIVHQ
jgi:hypothetical protein